MVRAVGMVTTQQIGTTGSQALRESFIVTPMRAVHRLNGGGFLATAKSLRYSRSLP
jgi:hypothetical protein